MRRSVTGRKQTATGEHRATPWSVTINAVALSNANLIGGGLVPKTLIFGTPPVKFTRVVRPNFLLRFVAGRSGAVGAVQRSPR